MPGRPGFKRNKMAKQTAMGEAVKLASELGKINMREAKAAANMQQRYQQERNELLELASDAAKRILAAAESEVAG